MNGDEMRIIKFTEGVAGLTASYAPGQTVELTNKTAEMYVDAKKASYVAAAGEEKQRIDEQNVEIAGLKDELIECKNSLDVALGDVVKYRNEHGQLAADNKGLLETSRIEGDINAKYYKEIQDLKGQIAELLNRPVDGGTAENSGGGENAESNGVDLADRQNEKAGEGGDAVENSGEQLKEQGENSVDGGKAESNSGDGAAAPDEKLGSGDDGGEKAVADVKPAVVTDKAGVKRKAMPGAGGADKKKAAGKK